jgi:hypothetical protein
MAERRFPPPWSVEEQQRQWRRAALLKKHTRSGRQFIHSRRIV